MELSAYANALHKADINKRNTRNLAKILKAINDHPNISYEHLAVTTGISVAAVYRACRLLKEKEFLKNKRGLWINKEKLANLESSIKIHPPKPDTFSSIGARCLIDPVAALEVRETLMKEANQGKIIDAIALYAIMTDQLDIFRHIELPADFKRADKDAITLAISNLIKERGLK
jgi:DNA-binding MurR/RpiR family transcriptional regulator